MGISCGAQTIYLWHMGSKVHGLSSWDSKAWLLPGMWDISSLTRDRTRRLYCKVNS